MSNELEQTLQQALAAITEAQTLDEIEEWRIKLLGKQGLLTQQLKALGQMDPEVRKVQGVVINLSKTQLQNALNDRSHFLKTELRNAQLAVDAIDVTLPGRGEHCGGRHPITRSIERIENYFSSLGFIIAEGPEIEDQFYNFEALNIPETHPARQTQDTFYFPDGKVLRTHTSPVQIRTLKMARPPIRMIAPGRVYRCDSDLTHTPMFHQIECLMVDTDVTMAQLKSVLQDFLNFFFEQTCQLRFRPSYFPFTEPSAEVDMQCVHCQAKGCRVCSNTGWLEVLGCGMVHPNVLQAVEIDSEQFQGFAFGAGIDRLTMLRYGVNDLRLFFENDLRMLKQF